MPHTLITCKSYLVFILFNLFGDDLKSGHCFLLHIFLLYFDFRGQFGNGGASNMQGVQNGRVNSSTRGKNKSSNLSVEGSFNVSGGWMDPKIASPFSHGESSRKKATKRNSTKNSVSKSKNKAYKSNHENLSFASADWVEPKSCSSLPKDAGKRRVQASGQSAGHWYTSPEGRKVCECFYVNCFVVLFKI